MMKYFKNCKTLEEVKKTYKEWAKKLHPDCGGDPEEFKAMLAEYEIAFERCKNCHQKEDGSYYQKETKETSRAYADIIDAIIRFEGVGIEIIGTWIWVSGRTMPYKDDLKALGFWWSKAKKAWYYTGDKEGWVKTKGHYSMNGLRNKWGSEVITPDETAPKHMQIGIA